MNIPRFPLDNELHHLLYLICFWKPLSVVERGCDYQGNIIVIWVERGDKLILHHPVSWIEKLLLRVHGVELEIH